MIIHSRKELYRYLDSVDWNAKKDTKLSSVYFLIKYNDHVAPIYFTPFEDVWFEAPCALYRFPLKDSEVMEYIKEMYQPESIEKAYEFEKTMQRDGWHYDIDVPQCGPFLPEEIEIINIISETECLDWLLEHSDW